MQIHVGQQLLGLVCPLLVLYDEHIRYCCSAHHIVLLIVRVTDSVQEEARIVQY